MITLQQKAILDQIKYKDWVLLQNENYIQWSWWAPCSKTGEVKFWKSRKWYISEHMVESELVGTAFLALKTALEHEAREFFTYEGRVVYNPHVNIQALSLVCNIEETRK